MLEREKLDANRKIEDGTYFKDARQWYMDKYVWPISERTYLFFLTLIVAFAILFILYNIQDAIIDKKRIPIIKYMDDTTNFFSNIVHIRKKDESPQNAVARYLISDYIKTREEYIPKIMQDNILRKQILRKIKITSVKNEYIKYKAYVNPSSKFSPLVRYKNHTTREIKIDSVNFFHNEASSGRANIVFSAKVTFENLDKFDEENKSESYKYRANIKFNLPDIETIAQTGAPLRFVVNSYTTTPL